MMGEAALSEAEPEAAPQAVKKTDEMMIRKTKQYFFMSYIVLKTIPKYHAQIRYRHFLPNMDCQYVKFTNFTTNMLACYSDTVNNMLVRLGRTDIPIQNRRTSYEEESFICHTRCYTRRFNA